MSHLSQHLEGPGHTVNICPEPEIKDLNVGDPFLKMPGLHGKTG